jgi:hypothetical protein
MQWMNRNTMLLALASVFGVGADHVEFTLGDTPIALAAGKPGPSDPTDHGSLTGLLDDDHPQYLPANGVRSTLSGFAVTGFDATSSASLRLLTVRNATMSAGTSSIPDRSTDTGTPSPSS